LFEDWNKAPISSTVLQISNSNIVLELKRLYPDIFSSHSFDVGSFSLVEHCIDTSNFKPFYSPTGRIPLAYESRVNKMVDDLLKMA